MVDRSYCAPLSGENQQTVQMADLNGDGTINNRDLGLLQKYLNGDDVTLRNPFEDYDGTIQN
jgi:hypothetical protein